MEEYKYANVVIDGNQQRRLVKRIKNKHLISPKTKQPILPECVVNAGSDGSINVSGFQKVNECLDEISPWNGFCKFWNSKEKKSILNDKKINACKLKGRGIIIKQANNKLLRISNCEYHRASQHFYCSGKLEYSHPQHKVYFERYGIELPSRKNNPNCPEKQTLLSGRGEANFYWDETTNAPPHETAFTAFINWPVRSKNNCLALDAEPDSDLITARQADQDNFEVRYHHEYMRQISLAKVLCMSRYLRFANFTDFKYYNMFGYYKGGSDNKAMRASCWYRSDHKDFICKDEKDKYHVLISSEDVKANFGGKVSVRNIASVQNYDRNKKMLRLRSRYLASKQRAFYPYSSKERQEYDYRDVLVNNREQRRYVQVIEKVKSLKDYKDILPLCQGSGSNISGFEEKKVCASELSIYKSFCKGKESKTVNVCKMAKGRGILIKKDNGNILRVASCEFQPAASHFYCSGKIGKKGKMQLYFERYGTYIKKVDIATVHRCPETSTTVNDAQGNDVAFAQAEQVVQQPAKKTCQANTTIDNCDCESPLLTHGTQCLGQCPDGYEQQGTGCQQVVTPPPAPVSCSAGQAISGNDASDSSDDCSCDAPMHASGGLCCNSGDEFKDGQCVTPPPTCNDGDSTAGGCQCSGHEYNGTCYLNGCPQGTEDSGNGTCTEVVCSVGDDVSSCDCNSPMQDIRGYCCEAGHDIYADGCKTCEAGQFATDNKDMCLAPATEL